MAYEYKKLTDFINDLNKLLSLKKLNEEEKHIYYLLRTLFDYLTYTEGQVRIQEKNLALLVKYSHKNHAKYTDRLYKMYSSTIASYSHMSASLEIIERIRKIFRKKFNLAIDYQKWIKNIIDIRNRLSAHPADKWGVNIISYGSDMWSFSGEVRFRLINLDNPEKFKKPIVNPKKDFRQLMEYINVFVSRLEEI